MLVKEMRQLHFEIQIYITYSVRDPSVLCVMKYFAGNMQI